MYLPTYLLTYLHKLNFLFKKCTYLPTYLPIYINWIFYLKNVTSHILIVPSGNMWLDYNVIEKMIISCKLHMNDCQIKTYMLTIYYSQVNC
jgi:hypothetical protein